MASRLFLLTLILCLPLSSATHPNPATTAASPIQQACKATRFPDKCQATLNQKLPPNPTPLQTIQVAINVTSSDLSVAQKMVKDILDASAGNENRTLATKDCLGYLHNSEYRISLTNEALSSGRAKTARAAMSAALLYQYDCWSALKYTNDSQMVSDTMSFLNNTLTVDSSNALGMMFSYENYGNDTNSWTPPKTERDWFWGPATLKSGSKLLEPYIPKDLKPDVTVCKDQGAQCSRTVQEVVEAAPENSDKKFVILIKAGVYEEIVNVPLEKRNVVFLGEGMGKTVITGSLNVGQHGVSTYTSATVGVLGDGFMASNLTIQNTAGPDSHQAVAFRSGADRTLMENCEFLGHQDTLYAHGNRQLYKSCIIQGTVDFIFGNSAAVFEDCTILVAPRQLSPEKGENNVVTAHGRTEPSQSTGFVFQNCTVNGTEEYMKLYKSKPQVHKSYLGRPWKEYSRVVYINCDMEELVTKEGWMPWDGDFALKTLYYGEYGNTGPGSDLSKRVEWSSRIPAEHVGAYSVESFIQGDEW